MNNNELSMIIDCMHVFILLDIFVSLFLNDHNRILTFSENDHDLLKKIIPYSQKLSTVGYENPYQYPVPDLYYLWYEFV